MSFLTFTEIAKMLTEKQTLWVRNISPPPRKILIIDYPSAEGGRAFNIPRTNLPFNICDHVDAESLRNSKSFRDMFNAGMLEVVDEEAARNELKDPLIRKSLQNAMSEAKNTHAHRADEVRKNQEADAAVRAEQQANTSQGTKSIIAALDPALAKALNLIGANGMKNDPTLVSKFNPRLVALEDKIKAGNVPVSLVMTELSSMIGDLSIDDMTHVAAGGVWPKDVAEWARNRVAFLVNRRDQEDRI
jgi:hypothetical protein